MVQTESLLSYGNTLYNKHIQIFILSTDFDISLTKRDARMLISVIKGEIGSCFKIKIEK